MMDSLLLPSSCFPPSFGSLINPLQRIAVTFMAQPNPGFASDKRGAGVAEQRPTFCSLLEISLFNQSRELTAELASISNASFIRGPWLSNSHWLEKTKSEHEQFQNSNLLSTGLLDSHRARGRFKDYHPTIPPETPLDRSTEMLPRSGNFALPLSKD